MSVNSRRVLRPSVQHDVIEFDEEDWEMESVQDKRSNRPREEEYDVETYDHLVKDLRDVVEKTADMLQISQTCARLLLAQKKWNMEDCVELFYGRSNKFVADLIKVPVTALKQKEWSLLNNDDKNGQGVCSICLEEVPCYQLFSLSCLHTYCNNCWRNHIESVIDGEMDQRIVIRCMEPDCKLLLDDCYILYFAGERQTALYWKLIEKQYVDSLPRLRSCRGLDCNYAIHIRTGDLEDPVELMCKCGFVQCSKCVNEGHRSLPCWLVDKWIKKLGSDTDQSTLQWLMSNTKECPKCKYNIEKSGGCNHMTCRTCRHEFCWLCGDNWNGHANCTQYCGDAQGENFTAKAWEQMERLIFYASRYSNQLDNMKQEKPLKELSVKIRNLLLEQTITTIPANYSHFVDEAVSTLETCRRHLWQCFGFSFFVKPSVHRELFDHNIENLERDVDQLSGFLEQKLGSDLERYAVYRAESLTLSQLCRTRLEHLMGHIAEGFEKKWWSFDDAP